LGRSLYGSSVDSKRTYFFRTTALAEAEGAAEEAEETNAGIEAEEIVAEGTTDATLYTEGISDELAK